MKSGNRETILRLQLAVGLLIVCVVCQGLTLYRHNQVLVKRSKTLAKQADLNKQLLQTQINAMKMQTSDRIYRSQVEQWRMLWLIAEPTISIPEIPGI